MDESRATISRAVEHGWVIRQPRGSAKGVGGKPLAAKAALTDEGPRLARKGR